MPVLVDVFRQFRFDVADHELDLFDMREEPVRIVGVDRLLQMADIGKGETALLQMLGRRGTGLVFAGNAGNAFEGIKADDLARVVHRFPDRRQLRPGVWLDRAAQRGARR